MRIADRRSVLGATAGLLVGAGVAKGAGALPRVAIATGKGVIVVELETSRAPITSANFLHYVDHQKYDNGSFFRTVRTPGAPQEGQIVGAPSPHDHPFPPIKHESTTQTGLRHVEGTISLGRFEPGSATSNFFICTSEEPYLDAHPGAKGDNLGYAAFGRVVSGMAAVRRIHAAHTSQKAPFPDQRGQWLSPPVPILTMRRA